MALTAASIPFGPEEHQRLETDGFVTLPDLIPPSGVATLNVSRGSILRQSQLLWLHDVRNADNRLLGRCGDMQNAIDDLLTKGGGDFPGGADGWTGAWLWDNEIGNILWEVASASAVVALMQELCGPNVCLWAGGLATKAPANAGQDEAGTIPWHQDAP